MESLDLAHFEKWLEAHSHASAQGNAAASASLFSPSAQYYESPFDKPLVGRDAIYDYWSAGARTLTDKTSNFEVLAPSGNLGIAYWRSSFIVVPSAARMSLDCLFLVEFDEKGLCICFREWWHMQECTSAASSVETR